MALEADRRRERGRRGWVTDSSSSPPSPSAFLDMASPWRYFYRERERENVVGSRSGVIGESWESVTERRERELGERESPRGGSRQDLFRLRV